MAGLFNGGLNTEIITGNISRLPLLPNTVNFYVSSDDTLRFKKISGEDVTFLSSLNITSLIESASGNNTAFTALVSSNLSQAIADAIVAAGGDTTAYVDQVSANLAGSIGQVATDLTAAIETASGNNTTFTANASAELSQAIAQGIVDTNASITALTALTSASLLSINGITSPDTRNIGISGLGGIVIGSEGTTITISAAPVDLSDIYSNISTLAASATDHEVRIESLETTLNTIGTVLNDTVTVVQDVATYTITHAEITGASFPVVSLVVPNVTSTLYVQGIYNVTTTGFDVVLSGLPDEDGYYINWQRSSPGSLKVGGGTTNSDVLGTGSVIITSTQSIVPNVSGVYDLGSVDKPWKDLYLTGNSIHLGDTILSSTDGTISINGSTIVGSDEWRTCLTSNILLAAQVNATRIGMTDGWIDTLTDTSGLNVLNSSGLVANGKAASLSGSIVTPKMTSNTAPSGVASASSEFGDVYAIWKAFNRTNADYSDCWVSNGMPTFASSATWQWLKFDLGLNNEKTVTNYSVTSRNYGDITHPSIWDLQGSNDNTNWTNLHSISGQSFTSNQTKNYSCTNSGNFRYYRILVKAMQSGSSNLAIGELQLKSSDSNAAIESTSSSVPNASELLFVASVNSGKDFLTQINTGSGMVTFTPDRISQSSAIDQLSAIITGSNITSASVKISANTSDGEIYGWGLFWR